MLFCFKDLPAAAVAAAVASQPTEYHLIHGKNISSAELTPKIIAEFLRRNQSITVQKLFSVRKRDDIKKRSKYPLLSPYIKEQAKYYYQLNIGVAFNLLGNVAQLLRVAYAGCKGYSCSTKVLDVLSSYQTLVSDSKMLSYHLVRVAIKALRFHGYAHRYAEVRDNKMAVRAIKGTIELAKEMSKKSKAIADESREITLMSKKAMLDASKLEHLSTSAKKKVELRINKESLNQDMVKTLKKLIKMDRKRIMNDITQFRELSKEIQHSIEKQLNSTVPSKKCNLVDTKVKVDCTGLSCLWKRYETITVKKEFCNIADRFTDKKRGKGIDDLKYLFDRIRETQNGIRTKQNNITQLYLYQYRSLSQSVIQLRHSRSANDELVKAIHSLEIAGKALAIVKTAFEKAVEFWTSVVQQTEELTDMEQIDLEAGLGLQELILESGFRWLVLGKVCMYIRLFHVNKNDSCCKITFSIKQVKDQEGKV